jgi:MFS family permease
MLATLRQRNFALLWWGGLISMIGDWSLLIGLAAYVYQMTGSTLATGLTFIVQILPGVLLGSVAGVFADRWDRKRILVTSGLLQTLVVLPLLAANSAGDVWIVYAVGFAQSVVGVFGGPAESSLLPQLVGEERLVPANSLNALNNNLARLTGPAIGGAVFAYGGLGGVVLLDAASFLIGAGLTALIAAPSRARTDTDPDDAADVASAWLGVWRDWLDGLRLVRRNGLVAGAFMVIAVAAFADAIASPLWVPFVYEILGAGPVQLGWLSPAQGIGGIAGSFLLARLGDRIGLGRLIAASAAIIGLVSLAMFNIGSLPLTLALLPVSGAAVVGLYTGLQTLLQTSVEDEYRGRVFGAYGTTNSLLGLAGMGLGGALGDLIPVIVLLNIVGVGYIVSAAVARTVLRGAALRSTMEDGERAETQIMS